MTDVECPRHSAAGIDCYPTVIDLADRIECAIGLGAGGVKATARTVLAIFEDHRAAIAVANRGREPIRGDHWKRVAVEIEQDRDQLLVELGQARTARITYASLAALIDPVVHTPNRIEAHLEACGWVQRAGYPLVSDWHRPDRPLAEGEFGLLVPNRVGADYARRVAEIVVDLATLGGVGELQVLADIAATGKVARESEPTANAEARIRALLAELDQARAAIRRVETMELRTDGHRWYVTSFDLARALWGDDPQAVAPTVAAAIPGMLESLRDRLRTENEEAGEDA